MAYADTLNDEYAVLKSPKKDIYNDRWYVATESMGLGGDYLHHDLRIYPSTLEDDSSGTGWFPSIAAAEQAMDDYYDKWHNINKKDTAFDRAMKGI